MSESKRTIIDQIYNALCDFCRNYCKYNEQYEKEGVDGPGPKCEDCPMCTIGL